MKETFMELKEKRKTYKQTERKKGYNNNVYAFGGERVIHWAKRGMEGL